MEHARSSLIENWTKSFADGLTVLREKQQNEIEKSNVKQRRCFIINPIVGPEAITGSTRMKGCVFF